MENLILIFKYYFLIFIRVSSIFILIPIINSKVIPVFVRTFIVFSIGIIIVISTPPQIIQEYNNLLIYSLAIIKETLLGLFIGFFVQLSFVAIKAAGDIISFNTMFSISNVINPSEESQSTLWGEFYNVVAIFVFLLINGHIYILKAIIYSFKKIPVDEVFFVSQKTFEIFLSWGSAIFYTGIAISSTIVIVLFISNIGMGIISRTIPQLNVLIVGLPMQILLAFLIMLLILPVDIEIIKNIFWKMFKNLHYLFNLL